jgi:hypothetical protein
MHPARRHSYAWALALSALVHAALVACLAAFSGQPPAAPGHELDTRTTAGPSGLIYQLLLDELEEKNSASQSLSSGAPDPEPAEFVAKIIDPPILSGAGTQSVAAPVVAGSPGGPAVGSGHSARGTASGNALFAATPQAKSVVYVLDRSGSMGQQSRYRIACAEVIADLNRRPPGTRFQVVPYNSHAEPLCIDTSLGLLAATAVNIEKAGALLAALPPTGWTDHVCGLRRGLVLVPDVLYLVTDADDLKPDDVRTITSFNHGRTVIYTIELHARYAAKSTGALAELAARNHGAHRRVVLDD